MKNLPPNVWILTSSQALMMSINSMVVFVGGILGARLAPEEKLATLPTAVIIVGTALSTVPVTMLMRKFGRKQIFLGVAIYSAILALVVSYAIYLEDFIMLCVSMMLFGVTSATIQQFRFAAMESVNAEQTASAASTVLIGGIAAAFIGPEIAVFGKDLMHSEFAGSFVLVSGLFLIGLFLLLGFKNPEVKAVHTRDTGRSLKQIARQGKFWVAVVGALVGYAVMSFVMTATPIGMHVIDKHSLESTKFVIQSHILAMFIPSFLTGWLIKRLGIYKMMIAGVVLFALCIAIGVNGDSLTHYWLSLVLLGVGWNFLFVGGTSLLPQTYETREKFKVQALNEFIIFGGQAVAALSAGWFIYAVGWETMLMFCAPFLIFFLLIMGFAKRA
ncbi:MAG: MFS transporter [Cyclobacteriaceae bacterium]